MKSGKILDRSLVEFYLEKWLLELGSVVIKEIEALKYVMDVQVL